MKWLAGALLLANAAFLGWNYLEAQRPGEMAQPPAPPLKGKRIELVSELAREPSLNTVDALKDAATPAPSATPGAGTADASTATGSPKPPSVPKQVCYRVNGLADAATARRITGQLTSLGARMLAEGSESATETKYWVFLPPFRTRSAAQSAIAQLKRRGFTDYYLVKGGQNANAVSLGVFSDRAGAERRLSRIRRYGFTPKLDETPFPVQRRWVLYRWEASAPFPAAKAGLPTSAVSESTCSR